MRLAGGACGLGLLVSGGRGATPRDGRLGLVLPRGQIETIAAYPEEQDRSEIAYTIALQANGDARIRRTRRFFGADFMRENRRFAEMSPEERRRYFQEAVAGVSQSARPEGELLTNFSQTPGIEEFTVHAAGFAVKEGDYLYLLLPDTFRDLLGLRADRRENPLYWRAPQRCLQRIEVKLPPDYSEILLQPPNFSWRAPADLGIVTVASACQVDEDGSRLLVVESAADLLAGIIPAAAYDDLWEAQRRLGHTRNRLVLLKRTQPAE
ncbi:MAG: hypothetical protein N3A66_11680 [Planctomycetota bacterium]|nr:hypothetical protein [Planctomycetota bacterium]